ncbi:hypothetical protein Syun_001064 [Stephania yunnanensis]|uniref:Uncharacterized protein n=1 Tax=Stephania yunnanensis TaxID=152371 RepID=A0AAP0Q7D5_9MAGN
MPHQSGPRPPRSGLSSTLTSPISNSLTSQTVTATVATPSPTPSTASPPTPQLDALASPALGFAFRNP